MERRPYSQAEKAAIVLLTLGEEDAAEILRALPKADVRRILNAMARLGRIDELTADNVMTEFAETLAALKHGIEGSPESAARFLHLFARQRGLELDTASIVDFATPALRDTLARTDLKALGRHLAKEHPQVVAVVAVHLEPKRMGQLLRGFSAPIQSEVIQRIARLQTVSPELIQEIEETIRTTLAGPAFNQARIGGVDKIAATLNAMLPGEQETFLANLEQRDPQLAEAVKASMFTFNDLLRIDTRSLQRLLREIQPSDLTAALRGANQDLKDHFFSSMSERNAHQLQLDLDSGKKLPHSVVQTAQAQIAILARKLLASGEIQRNDEVLATNRSA